MLRSGIHLGTRSSGLVGTTAVEGIHWPSSAITAEAFWQAAVCTCICNQCMGSEYSRYAVEFRLFARLTYELGGGLFVLILLQ